MPVTNDQMLWLRAYLDGELTIMEQLTPQVMAGPSADGLGALLYAAFVIAAHRKFSPTWSRAEVIQFVARARALLPKHPDALDPLVAENLLRAALGERIIDSSEVQDKARAQLLLLSALAAEADLDDNTTSDLLFEACTMANRTLAEEDASTGADRTEEDDDH